MSCSTPGFLRPSLSPGVCSNTSIESVMPATQLILCRPLLLLSSIFLSIRVFSNESVLPIRWPNYWSFSFNSSPSNEYSGLISFRRDWLDLLAEPKSLGCKTFPLLWEGREYLWKAAMSGVRTPPQRLSRPQPLAVSHRPRPPRIPPPTPGISIMSGASPLPQS